MIKKYRVEIPVCDTIVIHIEAKNMSEAQSKAISEAIDKHPMVYWEIDDNLDIEVTEN